MDHNSIFEQAVNITKVYVHDNVLVPQVKALQAENEALKKDVEIWKNIALKYREIVTEHEKSIQEFLKK